ncbi:MAG: ATP-binding cassette domain-containing protein [Bacilli bacterium]|nr:ATP-binding cassette domain-containing protein [Bacilli bacterium]
MKKIIVYQEETSDCGVACLLSIIRYYNGDANLETLRMDSNTTNKGVSAYDLIKCAQKNGFNAIGYKDINISKYKLPCILHIKINQSLTHFVVLYEINNKTYSIMDPAKGLIKLAKNELLEKFTGNLIVLDPLGDLPKKKNKNIIKKELINQIKSFKSKIIKILLLETVFIILSLTSSFYIKIYNYPKYIIILSILFIFISIFTESISYLINKKIYNLENKINFNLADYFFNHILKLPLKYLHLKDPGEIVKRANEISIINEILINLIISTILEGLIILSILPIIFNLSLEVTIIILITNLLITIMSMFNVKKLNRESKLAIDTSTEYNNILIDGIYGLTSIKHSCSELYLKNKLSVNLKDKLLKEKKYSLSLKKYNTLKLSILSLSRILINLYLVNKIYQQKFTFEEFLIIITLIEIILSSSSNIVESFMELSFIKNLFNKANDFYNIPLSNIVSNKNFRNGDIKFKNINYNYISNYPLIKNFTTTIKQGEKVIIKGESGTGKSTLCKLLYQEINEFSGKISIGNLNIKTIDSIDYQNNVVYSSQVEKIFSASIKENILLGKEIEKERLDKIIETCELNRVLKKRVLGLDTMLFSGGEELSGGERQLIILARALTRNFNILILDETLSEVNDELEDKILKNIFKTYKDKTIIYVTHKNNKNYFSRVINV